MRLHRYDLSFLFSCLFLLLSLLSSGCGKGSSSALKGFEPYAKDTIVGGKSWAGMTLNSTTLAEVVAKFGVSRVDALLSDDTGLELTYGGQVCLVFAVDKATLAAMDSESAWYKKATRDLQGFLKAEPGFGNIKVTSIALLAPKDNSATFFRGKTDSGISLGDNMVKADAQKGSPTRHPTFLAGAPPGGDKRSSLFLGDGMVVFYEGKYQHLQAELMKAKPDSDDRKKIEDKLKQAIENTKITRICIY